MPLKRCYKCKQFKNLGCFSKDKSRRDGRCYRCKECERKYCENHKKEIRQYRQDHREKGKEYGKQYNQDHREEIREWRKQYRQDHKEEMNEQDKIRRQTDLKYNLNCRMSNAICESLRNGFGKRGYHWEDLVGYTCKQLKRHLKKTMPDGYSWQDFLEGKLHIDHIFPVSVFVFSCPEDIDFQRCWALDNLRLLPAEENLRKRAKLIKPFQKSFAMEVKIQRKEEK